MTRQRVKFALVANENTRAVRLKKLWSGLMKKLREISILCDVKLCVLTFSPNNAEPMVWPTVEAARALIGDYNGLPEIVKIESYMNEKIRKAQEKLEKSRMNIMEREIDQLMVQIHGGRSIDDLDVNVINALLSFSSDKIMQLRKRVVSVEHLPLSDPPRIRIGTENQTYYLIDQWGLPSPEPLNPQIHQKIEMGMASFNEIQDPRSYLPFQGSYHPYQGSTSSGNPNLEMHPIVPPVMPFQYGMHGSISQPLQHPYQGNISSGNPNLEMQPIVPPVMPFHGMVGPVSQPLHHQHNMNNNPIMAMSQQLQYPFDDVMSREEQSNLNIGGPQFHWSSNSMPTNDDLRQDQPPPPPSNEATAGEGNDDATSFDPNRDWPGINDHHF